MVSQPARHSAPALCYWQIMDPVLGGSQNDNREIGGTKTQRHTGERLHETPGWPVPPGVRDTFQHGNPSEMLHFRGDVDCGSR